MQFPRQSTLSALAVPLLCAPPLLGEHTVEVLRWRLGYSDAEIASLRKDEVIWFA